MYYPSYQNLEEYFTKGYRYLPIGMKKKIEHFNPIGFYEKVQKQTEYHFIFESGKIGRYTYMGRDPLLVIQGKAGKISSINRQGIKKEFTGNPLDVIKKIMNNYRTPKMKELPEFYGGAIGYLSYDMVQYFENLPSIAKDDLETPDLLFMLMDKVWIYDHQERDLYYIEYMKVEDYSPLKEIYETKINQINQIWDKWITTADDISKGSEPQLVTTNVDRKFIETSFLKEEFIEAVRKIQAYITQGDVFQVNLSVRQSRLLKTDAFNIYRHLRTINPSPYMGLIHFPDMQLVSASPELLIEVKNGYIQTRPIAGTRPRGKNEREEEQLVQDLLQHEKEVAEHIMLVDLERNDLGRVCKYGTVKVNELMVIEKYSHVMHIVSNVIGEIDKENDIYDCIKAAFPGGTITGAPKIRTMEIIEELEPVKRGPYTGSMGWIGFQGELKLNILIRTLLMKEGKGYVQAGAGIVIDSIPENEYEESLNKAEALWRAVENSEREMMKERIT